MYEAVWGWPRPAQLPPQGDWSGRIRHTDKESTTRNGAAPRRCTAQGPPASCTRRCCGRSRARIPDPVTRRRLAGLQGRPACTQTCSMPIRALLPLTSAPSTRHSNVQYADPRPTYQAIRAQNGTIARLNARTDPARGETRPRGASAAGAIRGRDEAEAENGPGGAGARARDGSRLSTGNHALLPLTSAPSTRHSNVQYADPRPTYHGNSGAKRDHCTFECAVGRQAHVEGGFRRRVPRGDGFRRGEARRGRGGDQTRRGGSEARDGSLARHAEPGLAPASRPRPHPAFKRAVLRSAPDILGQFRRETGLLHV